MHVLRKFLCWVFAFTSFALLQSSLPHVMQIIHRAPGGLFARGHAGSTFFAVFLPTFLLASAGVYGVAWWTIFRDKPAGRKWGIFASLMTLLASVVPAILLFKRPDWRVIWSPFLITLGVGVAGLFAFWRRYDQPSPMAAAQQSVRVPGDGTNNFINKTSEFLFVALGIATYFWWLRWCGAKGLFGHESSWHFGVTAMFALAIVTTTLHELGHTAAGLALGMKLRGLIFGPFQWRVRDGKWTFQFKPAGILSAEGATGVVPKRSDYPKWRIVCVSAAGPVANLLTGIPALWVALTPHGDLFAGHRGLLAFFGVWSLVEFALNLVPIRTGSGYSDGATIYQLLSSGPWGDFHRSMAVVRASLVTPLRPRNYDIEAIQRAARSIAQGMDGYLLRMYAYFHFLDCERVLEAGAMLREAESICRQGTLELPTELHPEFVFGNAYVLRDASAAREWWTRLEARKPTRFNVDYWKAKSALHWIEGHPKEANEAIEKAEALAQQLPKVGAYEFDRDCCSKLRQVLDEVPTTR